jgi:hypothetical protein
MEYFIISQDDALQDYQIGFEDLRSASRTLEVTTDQAEEIKDRTVVLVNGDEDSVWPDFIERPVVLVSDMIKQVMSMHDERAIFKSAVLNHVKLLKQSAYWLLLADRLDCLSDRTEFDKAGRVQRLVLDADRAEGHAVFRVAGIVETWLVINLDVAESLLRRRTFGMKLRKIETYNGRDLG